MPAGATAATRGDRHRARPLLEAAARGAAWQMETQDRPEENCVWGSVERCETVEPLLARCRGGDRGACLELADDASSTPPLSPVLARAALRLGCELGDAAACERAAFGDPENVGDGAAHEAACSAGDALACSALARATTDPEEQRRLAEQLCELGADREGCIALALHLSDSDPEATAEALRRACDLGDADGCDLLGRHHLGLDIGPAPVTDLAAALRAFDRACELGGDASASCDAAAEVRAAGGVPESWR